MINLDYIFFVDNFDNMLLNDGIIICKIWN